MSGDKLMGIISVVIAAGSVILLLLTVTGITVLWRFCKKRFVCCQKLDKWRKESMSKKKSKSAGNTSDQTDQSQPMLPTKDGNNNRPIENDSSSTRIAMTAPTLKVAVSATSDPLLAAVEKEKVIEMDYTSTKAEVEAAMLKLHDSQIQEITIHVPPRPAQLDVPSEKSRSNPSSRTLSPLPSNKLSPSPMSTPQHLQLSKSSSSCSSATQKSRAEQPLPFNACEDTSCNDLQADVVVSHRASLTPRGGVDPHKDPVRSKQRTPIRNDIESCAQAEPDVNVLDKRSRDARQAFQRKLVNSFAIDVPDRESCARPIGKPRKSSPCSDRITSPKHHSFEERRISLDLDTDVLNNDLHLVAQSERQARSPSAYPRHSPRMYSVQEELEDGEMARQQKYIAMWARKTPPREGTNRERKYAEMWRKGKPMQDMRTSTIESDCYDVQRGARSRGVRLGDFNAAYSLDDSLEPRRSSLLEVPSLCVPSERGRIDSGYRSHSGLSSKSATIDSDDAFCEAFVPPPPTPNRQAYKSHSMCNNDPEQPGLGDHCNLVSIDHDEPAGYNERLCVPQSSAARIAIERWQKGRETFGKLRCQSEVRDFHQLVTQALNHDRRQKRRLPATPTTPGYAARYNAETEFPMCSPMAVHLPHPHNLPHELTRVTVTAHDQHPYAYQNCEIDAMPLGHYPMQY